MAQIAQGPRVLDVGFAQLPNPWLLRSDFEVTGIDINAPPSPSGYQRELQGDVFDVDGLDEGGPYDSILAGELIEHLENPYDLLRFFHARVRPGGRLVLSTPNAAAFPTVFWEWTGSDRRFYSRDHTYYFTPRWVRRILQDTGWPEVNVVPVGLWPLGVPCPAGISYQVIYWAVRQD